MILSVYVYTEIFTAYVWGGWSEDREEMQRVTRDFHS